MNGHLGCVKKHTRADKQQLSRIKGLGHEWMQAASPRRWATQKVPAPLGMNSPTHSQEGMHEMDPGPSLVSSNASSICTAAVESPMW